MNEIRDEIARLEQAVANYERLIPYADGDSRQVFLRHQAWDLSILADYRRFLDADRT